MYLLIAFYLRNIIRIINRSIVNVRVLMDTTQCQKLLCRLVFILSLLVRNSNAFIPLSHESLFLLDCNGFVDLVHNFDRWIDFNINIGIFLFIYFYFYLVVYLNGDLSCLPLISLFWLLILSQIIQHHLLIICLLGLLFFLFFYILIMMRKYRRE